MHHSVFNDGLRLLSRPCLVYWAGWETDTQKLQQSGWSISAEQDMMSRGVRLAMRHEPMRLYAITNIVADVHWEAVQNPYAHGVDVVFSVIKAGSGMQVQLIESHFDFKSVDCQPQMTTNPVRDVEDMGIFQTPLTRTAEIIVEQADMSVIEHLEAIKELQAPKQAEIRQRMLKESAVQEGEVIPDIAPQQEMMAQIITFPRRATA